MKATTLITLLIVALLFAAGNALAECNCRQPAYKDQMDFFARYIACLDDCLNAQMQQIRLENRASTQRVSDLEVKLLSVEKYREPGWAARHDSLWEFLIWISWIPNFASALPILTR